MMHSAGLRYSFASILFLAAAIAVPGCTTLRSAEDAAEQAVGVPKGETYYAAAAGLAVRADAGATSKLVGRLALHEKVTRTDVQRGYAHVVAAGSSLEGWVDNALLIPRVPAATTEVPANAASGKAPPPSAEPEASDVAPAARDAAVPVVAPEAAPAATTTTEEATPAPTPAPAPEVPAAKPSKPTPAVYDPF